METRSKEVGSRTQRSAQRSAVTYQQVTQTVVNDQVPGAQEPAENRMKPSLPRPTPLEANRKPFLLHAEVGGKEQLHHIPGGVQGQPAGRRAAELDLGAAGVDHHAVVDAALSLLQVKVQEGELDDEAGRGLHGPPAGLRVGVHLRVTGRREAALDLRQQQVTAGGAAGQS